MIKSKSSNGKCLPCLFITPKPLTEHLKILLIMKFLALSILCFSFSISADIYAQKIDIQAFNKPFKNVVKEVQKQSGYSFAINARHMQMAQPVSANIVNMDLLAVLPLIFKDQPFDYKIDGRIIISVEKIASEIPKPTTQDTIRGKVINENGEPLIGASVSVKGTKAVAITGNDGGFVLPNTEKNATLIITYVGYENREVSANNTANIKLDKKTSYLDEVQVIPYGTTTRRLNTGSVSSITSEEISKQPVNNILGVLSGRVPGLEVTQSSGVPGASFKLQVRGRNSLIQGSEPLILVDGIPFAAQNENVNNFISSIGDQINGGGLSPFYSINPSDIESIEVLRDADATAIYGSRGANGVILISTKKERTGGETRVSANISQGFNIVPNGMALMNTEQYLTMRREAFQNSGTEPTINNAPDLLAWDKNKYTDLRKLLLGNTGHVTNAQLSLSGGSKNTQFLLGSGYFRETNILPDNFENKRGNLNFSLNHKSTDGKFQINFSSSYTSALNQAPGSDLAMYTFLPPNIPSFQDAEGNLQWEEHGTNYQNPLAYQLQKYKANTGNLMSSVNLQYSILPSLSAKLLAGYNELNNKDIQTFPRASYSPAIEINSSTEFGNTQFKSWNIEPQLEYYEHHWIGKLNILVGGTFQDKQRSGNTMNLTGFSSDALLESAEAASAVQSRSTTYTQYRYQAIFGRINYNITDKYIVNITARRDGSSRFGPERRYANFGAVGAAWIFSSETFIKEHLPFLSYGKIRGSYGVTGNDQIGDYQYIDAWEATQSLSYQNSSSLNPSGLFNPLYGWEKNKKLEAALELGFFNDRIFFTGNYYRNRSSNQLVQYKLPSTTGFTSIISNFPALIENAGWELLLNAQLIKKKEVQWNSSINLTLPKNTLLDYPDIENSSYNYTYVVGYPLNLIYNYESLGVNPETGTYHYKDIDENGKFNVSDYVVNGHTDPQFYGGFRNSFNYKGIGIDVFFDFRKQIGKNFLYSIYSPGYAEHPGTIWNQPVALLEHWQNEGDITKYEKFNSSALTNRPNPRVSNIAYSDQSFIRLRSLQLSYNLSSKTLSPIKAKNINIYIQGQNLFTWNKDSGYDPEVQNLYRMAPLKTYTMGIQLTY